MPYAFSTDTCAGILVGVGEVKEALQVGLFMLISVAAVIAALVAVWRDDHSWLDRPRH
jgi:hypothetical protein